jgi:hypothetical protein
VVLVVAGTDVAILKKAAAVAEGKLLRPGKKEAKKN